MLLLALLEGGEQHNREAVRAMRKELKLPGLRAVFESMLGADQRAGHKKSGPYRSAIIPLYVLMNRLAEQADDEPAWQHYTEKQLRPTALPLAGRWLRGAVQHVEIINARGELEKVHFPVMWRARTAMCEEDG